MSIVHGLHTRQVDYVNAFAQADLDKEVHIELPQGFEDPDGKDTVLKLNKSLYGMCESPSYFYDLLKTTLEKRGFVHQANIDPCLFVHPKR